MSPIDFYWIGLIGFNFFLYKHVWQHPGRPAFVISLIELLMIPIALLPTMLVIWFLSRQMLDLESELTRSAARGWLQVTVGNQVIGLVVAKLLTMYRSKQAPWFNALVMVGISWLFAIVGLSICVALPVAALAIFSTDLADRVSKPPPQDRWKDTP